MDDLTFNKRKTYASDKFTNINKFSDLIDNNNKLWIENTRKVMSFNSSKKSDKDCRYDSLKEEDIESSISPKKPVFEVIYESPIKKNSCLFSFSKSKPLELIPQNNILTKKRSSNMNFKPSAWSKEEDDLLLYLRNDQKISTWVDVSSYFPNKNPKQCSYRYKKLNSYRKNIEWTKEESDKLINFVQIYGENFETIIPYFPGRTLYGIREYYHKHLNSNVHFSNVELDLVLLEFYETNQIPKDKHCLFKYKNLEFVKNRLDLLLKIKGEFFEDGKIDFSIIEKILLQNNESSYSSIYLSNTLSQTNSADCNFNTENNINNNIIVEHNDDNEQEFYNQEYKALQNRIFCKDLSNSFKLLSFANMTPEETPILKLRRFTSVTSDNNIFNLSNNDINNNNYFKAKEETFEHSFYGVFNNHKANCDIQFDDEYNCMLENELKIKFPINDEINLFEKNKFLQNIFDKTRSSTVLLFNLFEKKLEVIDMLNEERIMIKSKYQSLLEKESLLVKHINSEALNIKTTNISSLVQSIDSLIKLIRIIKEKLDLVRKIESNV